MPQSGVSVTSTLSFLLNMERKSGTVTKVGKTGKHTPLSPLSLPGTCPEEEATSCAIGKEPVLKITLTVTKSATKHGKKSTAEIGQIQPPEGLETGMKE